MILLKTSSNPAPYVKETDVANRCQVKHKRARVLVTKADI